MRKPELHCGWDPTDWEKYLGTEGLNNRYTNDGSTTKPLLVKAPACVLSTQATSYSLLDEATVGDN